tara:strand:- start:1174 stop:2118 length:945 start_codon:yes stop_codon:yes gene_type:complete
LITSLGISLLGLIMLILGGELVVRGASSLAKTFGISQLVIGLTVVAFGTSAPELGVSLIASLKGNADIAIANVVGSNIFNIAFILGACALVSPLVVHLQLLKLDIPIFILASLITYFMSLDGKISFIEGLLLIGSVFIYTLWLVRASRAEKDESDSAPEIETSTFKQRFFHFSSIIGGILILVFGSRFLVQGASDLAIRAGISEAVIGLTLVAAGTSLPELMSSLMATIRGKTDIAIGNVIGSGIFNLLFILGGSSLFTHNGLTVSQAILKFDFIVMIGLAILSYPLLITGKKLVRWEGIILLMGYIGYCYAIF